MTPRRTILGNNWQIHGSFRTGGMQPPYSKIWGQKRVPAILAHGGPFPSTSLYDERIHNMAIVNAYKAHNMHNKGIRPHKLVSAGPPGGAHVLLKVSLHSISENRLISVTDRSHILPIWKPTETDELFNALSSSIHHWKAYAISFQMSLIS